MLSATGCATDSVKVRIPTPDAKQRAGCPDAFPALPQLAPLAPFTLPDGRRVVLLDTVQERDAEVARYIIEDARGAWHECHSVKLYDDGFFDRLGTNKTQP